MSRTQYYTLVASLPRLPYFETAKWLPLSRKKLDQRLTMLTQEDALQLREAERLVEWHRQPITRTTEQVARNYRRVMALLTDPDLSEFVQYRMAQRTALVALRRRQLGLGVPADDELWGVGPWLPLIKAGWDRSDLGLDVTQTLDTRPVTVATTRRDDQRQCDQSDARSHPFSSFGGRTISATSAERPDSRR